jgi:hypothetical protein
MLRFRSIIGAIDAKLSSLPLPYSGWIVDNKLCFFGCCLLISAVVASPLLACPGGSQFFAWGGDGGCVANGKMVQKCFHMGSCPSGWDREAQTDGKSWCCPPAPHPHERCELRGTAPFCAGECEVGETLKGRTAKGTQGCATGSKAICCRTVNY